MSFTFKGISSTNYLTVTEVSHAFLPPFEVNSLQVANMSGAKFVSKREGFKEIEVSVTVIADSPSDLMDRLRAIGGWLDSSTPQKLSFSNESDKYYWAIVNGETALDQTFNVAQGSITFLCLDPYAYATTSTSLFLISSDTLNLHISSTAPTFPTFNLTAQASTEILRIINQNSSLIEVTYPFEVDDVVEVDCDKGKVTINGEVKMQTLSVTSDFFSLNKGSNSIYLSSGFEGTVTYRDRWK